MHSTRAETRAVSPDLLAFDLDQRRTQHLLQQSWIVGLRRWDSEHIPQ